MSAETKELLTDIVIPLVTAVLGLFGGMHIERRKIKNIIKNEIEMKDNSSAETLNAGIMNIHKK